MNAITPNRGGLSIGYVTDLGPVEAGAVLYLRLWFAGPGAQAQVRDDFAASLGPIHGPRALQSFEALCDLCARHGRRPFLRHGVACKCLGADEACFANFVGYASDGEREDALLMATMIVRPDMAAMLVGLAQEFGFALKRIARATPRTHQTPATLH